MRAGARKGKGGVEHVYEGRERERGREGERERENLNKNMIERRWVGYRRTGVAKGKEKHDLAEKFRRCNGWRIRER